jgi:hypothetical protein
MRKRKPRVRDITNVAVLAPGGGGTGGDLLLENSQPILLENSQPILLES